MKILMVHDDINQVYKFKYEQIKEFLYPNSYIDNNKLVVNEFYLACSYKEKLEEFKKMGVKHIDFDFDGRGKNPIDEVKTIFKLYSIIRQIKPDLVMTYSIKPNIYGGAICRFMKINFIENITGLGYAFRDPKKEHKLIKNLYKIGAKKAYKIFFENEEDRDIFVREIGNINSCVLPGSGINFEKVDYKVYPKDNGEILFIAAARIMKEKGIEELIEAFKSLKKKYPQIRLQILGEIFEKEYEDLINDLNDKNIIEYYSYRDDIYDFFAKSHCLIHPSYHEGMSNVMLEMAAIGRPIIASDIAGCREIIEDKKTGFLVKAKDVNSLKEKMEEFINLSYEQKNQMGKKAREYVKNKFDRKISVKKTTDTITEMRDKLYDRN